MDDETEPLSGKPFFHVLLQKSHIVNPLTIPVKISRMLPSDAVPVVLTHGSRMWDMTYNGNHPTHKRLDPRWRTFVADNKLQVGDACLFELMECGSTIKFKVQILRGNFPFELLLRQDGSKDRPVIID
uniref:TF-B3 domain-containing protein n=1 Tax=Opuntia streptacantha TaxID=393608 RepID=A0A7C9D4I8_OPUST